MHWDFGLSEFSKLGISPGKIPGIILYLLHSAGGKQNDFFASVLNQCSVTWLGGNPGKTVGQKVVKILLGQLGGIPE